MLKLSSPRNSADEVAQIAVQSIEHGSEDEAIAFGRRFPGASQLPVNTRPTHQAEHHADRRQHAEEHADAQRTSRALAQGMEGTHAGGNENERKNAVDSPRSASSCAGRQEGRQHVLRTAVQNLGVVEASGEEREHAEESYGASHERKAAGEDRSRFGFFMDGIASTITT